jgi:hypothetical protein
MAKVGKDDETKSKNNKPPLYSGNESRTKLTTNTGAIVGNSPKTDMTRIVIKSLGRCDVDSST